jgi:sporulation protein YlmC with PRC-barrel domain
MMSAALAQAPAQSDTKASPPASTMAPKADAGAGKVSVVTAQKPDQWLASKFKGTDVLGSDNQKIGDVTDILFDKGGKIEAFVVSVGGFLGIGAKDVALAPSAFQVIKGENNQADKLKIAMNKDELKSAANFEPYNPPRTTGSGGMSGATPRTPAAPPNPL